MATSYTDRAAISATSFDTRSAGRDSQPWDASDITWGDSTITWNGFSPALSVTNRTEPTTSFSVRTSP